jgi:uncharacterized phosphosugar-binding protein
MSAFDAYLDEVRAQIDTVSQTQRDAIGLVAGWVADALESGRYLFVFGSGHSHLLAEELFYRAGGLARVIPILEEPLMLHRGAAESTRLERRTGYAAEILDRYPAGPGDVVIIASNSGRNAVPIEMALRARERGARVAALTSRRQCAAWPSRHPSGEKLIDVVDVVLDNGVQDGDASVAVPGLEQRVGPTSSLLGILLLNLIVVDAVEQAVQRGLRPDLYVSSNAGGDEHNASLIQQMKPVNPHL